MNRNILIISVLSMIILISCTTGGTYKTSNSTTKSSVSNNKTLKLHDTLTQYVSDECRSDIKQLLENFNQQLTIGKYETIHENEKCLEKVIREGGKTVYQFNFHNSIRALIVKENNQITSISTTTDKYETFVMMSLATIELCSDSIQMMFNNNEVFTGYIYKDIVAVPCETNDFHQILYFPKRNITQQQ